MNTLKILEGGGGERGRKGKQIQLLSSTQIFVTALSRNPLSYLLHKFLYLFSFCFSKDKESYLVFSGPQVVLQNLESC